MSNEIATYSMILSKLSLGKSGTECPTKTQILAINSLIVIDNASTYGANECVKIDDIRKKAETWNYYLTVSPTSMSFAAAAGAMPLTISSYKRKTINGVEQSGDTAVSLKSIVASGSGFSVSGTTVYASANEDTTNRTGTVTITQNESNKTVTISLLQYGKEVPDVYEYVFSVNPYKVSVDASGGSGQITIRSYETLNGSWHRDVDYSIDNSTLPSWASFNKSTSTFTIQSTTSTVGRTAKVYFDQDESGKRDYAELTQTGYTPPADNYVFTWEDGSTSDVSASFPWDFSANGTAANIPVVSTKNSSSQSWSVSSKPSWITTSTTSSKVTISASDNSGSARSGKVVLTQSGSGNTLTVNVSQGAKPAENVYVFTWEDGSTSDVSASFPWDFSANGTAANIPVVSTKNSSSQSWSVSSKPSWITTSTTSSKVTISASDNSGSARSGKVVLTQSGSGNTLTVNVSQGAKPAENVYVFTITPNTCDAPYSSASFIPRTVSTKNGSNIGYSLTSGDTDWVVVSTTGKITVEILKNTTSSTRSTTLVFTQNESGKTQSIKITQSGQPDEYILSMWPESNTSGVYTADVQNTDIEVRSLRNGQKHQIGVKSQPEWCTAYISSSNDDGIYHIDLLIQSNPLTQSRTGTIVFEQEDSGMTTSFTVSQGGAILKDNKLTITSLRYDTAFLFPAGITPVEGSNVYLSFIVPNTFTWKTSTGLTINRGTIYAGELANVYVRENQSYKLVKSFQLETGEQTITI